jgi:hypothetical protein
MSELIIEEEEKAKDFQTINFKGKEFRIYKWENKPIKDFVYPKGFRMAEFQELVDLIDNKKFEAEVWKSYYTKHWSKLQQNKEYCLSRAYLNYAGGWDSYYELLADSNGYGRVVVVRDLKSKFKRGVKNDN